MRFFSIIKWLIVCIFGFLFTVTVVIPLILMFVGYRVNVSSDKVAEIAAERKDVSLCKSILSYGLFIPQSGELRAHCIKTYASLTKDPSACALLMPSSYGLSCVGGAETEFDACGLRNEGVSWGGGIETYESCQKDRLDADVRRNQCCLVARVSLVKSENDCSSLISFPEMSDQCLKNLAFKIRDPNYCALIINDNTRSACIINAKAMEQDPSICKGCAKPFNSIDELK